MIRNLNKEISVLKDVIEHKDNRIEELSQLAYDAIDFFRILEDDGCIRIPNEGYHKQVIDEIKEDAKRLRINL